VPVLALSSSALWADVLTKCNISSSRCTWWGGEEEGGVRRVYEGGIKHMYMTCCMYREGRGKPRDTCGEMEV